jgi:hypothetical protein
MRKVVFLALLAAMLPAIVASAETVAEKQMAQKIGSLLKQSGQLHNYRIGVKYHDGTAILEGTVTSVEQRTTAVRLAERVKGVKEVQYKLEIPEKAHAASKAEASNDATNDGLNDASNEAQPASENSRYHLAAALDRAAQTDAEEQSSHVVHAYQQPSEPVSAPAQQPPMRWNNGGRTNNMAMRRNNMPLPSRPIPGMPMPGMMPVRQASGACPNCNGGPGMGPGMCPGAGGGQPAPTGFVPQGSGRGPSYDNASMPGYAWPSYASYPNYAALTYPQQYSPTAWPYIGPFYPYPQVPLAWRKVSLEWDDGWWFLDFSAHNSNH